MTQAKEPTPLPAVIRMRAERILMEQIKVTYYLDPDNTSLVKCIMPDDSVRYVDIMKRKEVPATQIKIDVENWGATDTDQLVGKPEPINEPIKKKHIDKVLPATEKGAVRRKKSK